MYVWLFLASQLASEGFDSYALLDGSGTWNETLRVSAISSDGASRCHYFIRLAVFIEMVHDNANPIAPKVYAA